MSRGRSGGRREDVAGLILERRPAQGVEAFWKGLDQDRLKREGVRRIR